MTDEQLLTCVECEHRDLEVFMIKRYGKIYCSECCPTEPDPVDFADYKRCGWGR